MRRDLEALDVGLSIGLPCGDVIGPPRGNWAIEWRTWAEEGLVDALVVDQNSSRCPSMWYQLWPMPRGYGYPRNPTNDLHLPPVTDLLRDDYLPIAAKTGIALSVARQWSPRSPEAEARLLALPGVAGLAFSTFRHDNPAAIARGAFYA